jgi:hypothetical protein
VCVGGGVCVCGWVFSDFSISISKPVNKLADQSGRAL